jgi:hypothetical protein
MVIEVTGTAGYPNSYGNLYVGQGSSVGTGSGEYDCRDTSFPGRCVINNPASGTWSIMFEATYGYEDISVAVRVP